MTGVFISFEGIECTGKSTQTRMLCEYFSKQNVKFISTSEPGGTKIGKSIRSIWKNNDFCNMKAKTELFLLAAARHQHVAEVIKPALEKGYIVMSDRFSDSTIAYQAYGRGLDLNLIKQINDIATDGLVPDLTFLPDILPEESFERLLTRSKGFSVEKNEKIELDRIENEKLEFFQKVRDGYLSLAKNEPDRFILLNAEKSMDQLHEEILNYLKKFLINRGFNLK